MELDSRSELKGGEMGRVVRVDRRDAGGMTSRTEWGWKGTERQVGAGGVERVRAGEGRGVGEAWHDGGREGKSSGPGKGRAGSSERDVAGWEG